MRFTLIDVYTVQNRFAADVVLASSVREVRTFMRCLMKWLKPMTVTSQNRFAIQLAVEEALVNSLKHGNQFDSSKTIRVHVAIGPKDFSIQIQDEGQGFNVAAVPDPTDPLNLERPSGRGLCLMRHYMQSVRFNAEGNIVTLIRQWEQPLRDELTTYTTQESEPCN
jgi:serine/threonine-protein kinase RsbW